MEDNKFKKMNDELKYYFKLYEERFNKKAFIQIPGGTPEKTINLIKESLFQTQY